jgi:hypothetical protein
MPLPGSWISAKYLFRNKFNVLNILFIALNIPKILFPCPKILLGHGNSDTLNVTNHKQSFGVRSS